MKIKINIGQAQLEFEGRDYKEVAKEASAFSQLTTCGLCKSHNVSIDYHSAVAKDGDKAGQSFDYYSVKCLDCTARNQLGQYKAGGWFPKKWEIYQQPQQQQRPPQQQQYQQPQQQPQQQRQQNVQQQNVQNAQAEFGTAPIDMNAVLGSEDAQF
jgi:hypothetical protein